jgi:addiction module HigA family antidote
MFPKKREPAHPGIILQEEFLKPLQMDAEKFAAVLGGNWSELKVEAVIKGKEKISDLMAHEFADVLGTTVEFWKRLAHFHQLWEQAQQQNEKGAHKPWKEAQ